MDWWELRLSPKYPESNFHECWRTKRIFAWQSPAHRRCFGKWRMRRIFGFRCFQVPEFSEPKWLLWLKGRRWKWERVLCDLFELWDPCCGRWRWKRTRVDDCRCLHRHRFQCLLRPLLYRCEKFLHFGCGNWRSRCTWFRRRVVDARRTPGPGN